MILYRVYGGKSEKLGSYWSRIPPAGKLQNKIDSALLDKYGNTQTGVAKIEVPKGAIIYEGVVGPQSDKRIQTLLGGGNQVFLEMVDPSWVIK